MPERANPETCWHNIIQQVDIPNSGGTYLLFCVSCDSTLDYQFYKDRDYAYDIDHNVWVKQPKGKGGAWTALDEVQEQFKLRDIIDIELTPNQLQQIYWIFHNSQEGDRLRLTFHRSGPRWELVRYPNPIIHPELVDTGPGEEHRAQLDFIGPRTAEWYYGIWNRAQWLNRVENEYRRNITSSGRMEWPQT
jgi:hypothetical protein